MDPSPPRFINASQLSRQATFNKKKRGELQPLCILTGLGFPRI